MAGLIKRGNVWHARWWENGRERWKTLSSNKLAAQEKLLALEKSIRGKRYGDPHEPQDIAWAEYVEKFLTYCKGNLAPATHERNRIVFSNFDKTIHIQRLSELTAEVLEQFKAKRKEGDIMPATINREVSILRRAAAIGKQRGYLAADLGSVAKLSVPKKRPVFYSEAEIQAMLERADPFWKTVVLLGFYGGLRLGEMLHLEWQDVDFERQELRIAPKEDWHPKDCEAREIDLHPALGTHLRAWKAVSSQQARVVPWDRRNHQFSMMFSSFLRRCGIAKGSLHSLRHSFASHLAMADVNLLKIARLMGHSNVQTTQIYAHLQPSSLREAVLRLPAIQPSSSNGSTQA